MRVVSITPRPEVQCVEPILLLDIVLAFQRGRGFPLGVAVQVRTEDKKLLGVARAMNLGQEQLSLDALESATSSEAVITAQLALPLSPKHFDYVEDLRSKHRKGDVVLECLVESQLLISNVMNAYLTVQEGAQAQERRGESGYPVVYKQHSHRDPFHSQHRNMWVLSGDGGRTFLQRETLRQATTVTIGASDWLHDYATPWTRTKYLVVELPQPELLTSTPNRDQRVNAAIAAAHGARDSLSKGEWNDVVEDLRPVWELLRNEGDIQALLQRDGYTPEAITALNETVKNQFDLASKFAHRTDKSGKNLAPEIRASKEDAFVCYSFALSLLNLLSRKIQRLR